MSRPNSDGLWTVKDKPLSSVHETRAEVCGSLTSWYSLVRKGGVCMVFPAAMLAGRSLVATSEALLARSATGNEWHESVSQRFSAAVMKLSGKVQGSRGGNVGRRCLVQKNERMSFSPKARRRRVTLMGVDAHTSSKTTER